MNTEIINDFKVIPIKLSNQINKEPKHKLFFGNTHFVNVLIVSKKHSGKTNLLYNLIKGHKILDKNTRVIIFSSSVNKDQTYIDMVNYLKRSNDVECYTSLYDGENKKKSINQLKRIMDELQKESKENKQQKGKGEEKKEDKKQYEFKITRKPPLNPPRLMSLFNNMVNKAPQVETTIDEPMKPKKQEGKGEEDSKYTTPKIIFIFDDLSAELKDKEITKLLKSNRHYKSTVIVISHSPLELEKSARSQADIVITFQGFEPSYIEHIRLICNSPCSEEDFYKIYKMATKDKYNFLMCEVNNAKLRKNFNEEIKLISNE